MVDTAVSSIISLSYCAPSSVSSLVNITAKSSFGFNILFFLSVGSGICCVVFDCCFLLSSLVGLLIQ